MLIEPPQCAVATQDDKMNQPAPTAYRLLNIDGTIAALTAAGRTVRLNRSQPLVAQRAIVLAAAQAANVLPVWR